MNVIPDNDQAYADAVQVIQNGGIVAHATETCYGLACDLSNPHAVRKLFDLKRRPFDMPVSALFPSTIRAKQYAEWNPRAEELAQQYLPGPLTIILPVNPLPPDILYVTPDKEAESIGIRISSHPTAMKLAGAYGKPISTTSANMHGEPEPYSVTAIVAGVDVIIDGGILEKNQSSTIVNCQGNEMEVLRTGTIVISSS